MKHTLDFRYFSLEEKEEYKDDRNDRRDRNERRYDRKYRFTLIFVGESQGEFVHLMMTGGSNEETQSMFQTSGNFSLSDEEITRILSRERRIAEVKGLKDKISSYLKN
jgi:hypothetical protein